MIKTKKSKYMIVWIKWEESENDNDWNTDISSYEEQEESKYADDEIQHVIAGPFPMMKQMMPVKIVTEKDFNFWMGHANFPVSARILEIIALCPGVEAIDILTPYRFRIATGLLFPPGEVMSGIAQTVIGYLQSNDPKEIQSKLC